MEQRAYVFGMIFALSNKLQLLGDQMDERLSVKQWLLLAGVLKCESTAPTLSDVAARIGSSRQNVKKMALLLEKAGFVRLRKDARDARALTIELTDECRAHLGARAEMEKRFILELFNGFEDGELAGLSNGLQKLEQNAREMGRGHEGEEE